MEKAKAEEIIQTLEAKGFFEYDDKSKIEQSKAEIEKGLIENDTLYPAWDYENESGYLNNRFLVLDIENLFETHIETGLEDYLEFLKKLTGIKTMDTIFHSPDLKEITIDGKKYPFYDKKDDKKNDSWDYAFIKFVDALKSEFKDRGIKENIYYNLKESTIYILNDELVDYLKSLPIEHFIPIEGATKPEKVTKPKTPFEFETNLTQQQRQQLETFMDTKKNIDDETKSMTNPFYVFFLLGACAILTSCGASIYTKNIFVIFAAILLTVVIIYVFYSSIKKNHFKHLKAEFDELLSDSKFRKDSIEYIKAYAAHSGYKGYFEFLSWYLGSKAEVQETKTNAPQKQAESKADTKVINKLQQLFEQYLKESYPINLESKVDVTTADSFVTTEYVSAKAGEDPADEVFLAQIKHPKNSSWYRLYAVPKVLMDPKYYEKDSTLEAFRVEQFDNKPEVHLSEYKVTDDTKYWITEKATAIVFGNKEQHLPTTYELEKNEQVEQLATKEAAASGLNDFDIILEARAKLLKEEEKDYYKSRFGGYPTWFQADEVPQGFSIDDFLFQLTDSEFDNLGDFAIFVFEKNGKFAVVEQAS